MPKPGSTTARGYDHHHQAARKALQPLIDSGNGYCTEPRCLHRTRHIPPGTPWDLAHTPDKQGYRGPAHVKCNRSEGARRGNQQTRTRRARRLPPW